jgi:hypothetical protein
MLGAHAVLRGQCAETEAEQSSLCSTPALPHWRDPTSRFGCERREGAACSTGRRLARIKH